MQCRAHLTRGVTSLLGAGLKESPALAITSVHAFQVLIANAADLLEGGQSDHLPVNCMCSVHRAI